MKRSTVDRLGGWPTLAVAAAIVLIAALLVWRLIQKTPDEGDGPAPTALVTVAAARAGPVSRTVEAYGVIAGSPAASRTVSAARDVIVQDVLVTPGQPVAAGAALAEVGDTPASGLAYHQAADAVTFAKRDLARVQRLYDQQLAANDQLLAAQKALADAQAGLSAQAAAGGGHAREAIVSPIAGVVGQVSANRGQQVAAGGALVTVVANGGLVAQLGLEPNRAAQVAVGQSVRVVSALDPNAAVSSRLVEVGRAVDPTTHLIAISAPAEGAGLPLGAAVRGEIAVATSQGLTVPRASVVYDEEGAHVFVVKAGKARQVAVTTGPEAGDLIAVTGALTAGDAVVVEGAYQLQDGLAVRLGAQ
ncbi:MAG TPA: efflux RND transporter periplasmic adaptor subunit [Caulobacteraceae bacterium]|nr:efflux RND transporter periplasmic adaptor subunit [Caulobacteraceae bacterium]